MVQLLDRIALIVAVLGLGVVAGCFGRMLEPAEAEPVEQVEVEEADTLASEP